MLTLQQTFKCMLGVLLLLRIASTASAKEEVYWYHNDHLGTPKVMTDQTGNKVWEAEYRPFGEITVVNAAITNNVRFPGQYYDEETGLHYNWHRDYEPETGRYLEADPAGLGTGEYHLYVYSGSTPLSKFDEYGLWGSDVHYGGNGYGTFEWATGLGLKSRLATWIAFGDNATDGADGPIPLGNMSRHFDLPLGGQDSRDFWAQWEMNKAFELASEGQCEAAYRHLGKGLHSVQDKFAHRDWSVLSGFHPTWFDDWYDPRNTEASAHTESASKAYIGSFAADCACE